MATTNLKQTGWFYHAPSKPKPPSEPADLPAPSQIPGLSGHDMPYNPSEEPKGMVFRDTDSKYVKLAKMGGRPDLLRIKTPVQRHEEAKAYPRNEWFYLEDNKMEDAEKQGQNEPQGPYQPSMPDYMVHAEYKPRGDNAESYGQTQKNLLSRDTSTVYQREGHGATDKTVRVKEARPSGYGIRQEKQKDRRQKQKPAMTLPERARAPPGELDVQRATSLPKPQEEERPLMSKILSFGYGKDDLEERQKWCEKEDARLAAQHNQGLPPRPEQTQPQHRSDIMHKKGRTPPTHGRRAGSGNPSEAGSQRSQRSQYGRKKQAGDEEKPDFFKLSKFQNVPAKVNSQRCAEEIEPMPYNPSRDLSDLQPRYAAAN